MAAKRISMLRGSGWRGVVLRFLFLTVGGLPHHAVLSQIRTPPAEPVCRKLVETDPKFREFLSCCDVDGGNSRWQKRSDGSLLDLVSSCGIWGIKPGPPELSIEPPAKRSVQGIASGRYRCYIGSPATPFDVAIQSSGRYTSSGNSSGAFSVSTRSEDSQGGFTKYLIRGGAFDGYFFMQRDNGRLQLGKVGWGVCEPQS